MDNKKGSSAFLLVGILFIVLVVGFIYFQKSSLNDGIMLPMETSSVPVQPQLVTDATAGWGDFRETTYGYRLKYPMDWIKRDITTQSGVVGYELQLIAFNPASTPTGDFLNIGVIDAMKFDKSSIACVAQELGMEFSIAGTVYPSCESTMLDGTGYATVYVEKSKFVYRLSCMNRSDVKKVCDQVFSTLTFDPSIK